MKVQLIVLSTLYFFTVAAYAEETQTSERMMDHPVVQDMIKINDTITETTGNPEYLMQKAMEEVTPKTAIAEIASTAEDSEITGRVNFTEMPEGLKVDVTVNNVPTPGKHGFHIHENGSCADTGKAAGGHFNPHTVDHGFLPKDGEEHAHMGDMGNIDINVDGYGTLSMILVGLNLTSGNGNVAEKAVILHEKEDDFGQPTGNAGGRIGCGIITLPENMENGGK